MTTYEVEQVFAAQNRLGEGPRWNADEQRLYWLDIEQHFVYRLDPEPGEYERVDIGTSPGCLAFREAGGLVLAVRDGFALWDFGTGNKLRFVADTEADKRASRFNDGVVDSRGRFWAGGITQDPTSSLYRLDADYTVHTMVQGVTIANGLGWSPDDKTMYFTDTATHTIFAFDYDAESGAIANRRPFIRVPDDAGSPDGLAVDAEGFIWSAHWGGWRITRYDPAGKIERVVRLPAAQVTACAFGGPDLTDLYITTAWSGLRDDARKEQPQAGNLFVLRGDIKGVVEPKFKG